MNINLKVDRIKKLIYRLESGESVSTRSLSRVLTESQMETLSVEWEEEKSNRKVPKPASLKKYEALVKTALASRTTVKFAFRRSLRKVR